MNLSESAPLANKRIALLALLLAMIALSFWFGSRYPSLDQKALMGGDTLTEAPISFHAALPSAPGDPWWQRVATTAANWGLENRQGMAFGLLFGAGFLALLPLLRRRGSRNGWLNTLLGLGIGAPLGVCVNCAAPVARGLHVGGSRLETTLAAMFSSPTLNVMVLTLLLSVFPLYLVVIKLGLTLVFILAILPLLARTLFRAEREASYADDGPAAVCELPLAASASASAGPESWPRAFGGALLAYLRSLWQLLLTTVPLMLLAGLLGAMVIETLPLEHLQALQPSLWGGLGVALFAIFLPLPIALDVVLAAALMAAGLPVFYVAILLFGFGIYSVYPWLIVGRAISWRVASALALVLVLLSLGAGYLAQYQDQRDMDAFDQYLEQGQ